MPKYLPPLSQHSLWPDVGQMCTLGVTGLELGHENGELDGEKYPSFPQPGQDSLEISMGKEGSGKHPDTVQCRPLPASKPMCPHVPVSLLQLRKGAKCREIKLLLARLHPQGWQGAAAEAGHFGTAFPYLHSVQRSHGQVGRSVRANN